MENWRIFEKQCTDYLNNSYANSSVHFSNTGGSDSTISDIAFIKNNSIQFYIESKMPTAQSGQFVLLDDSTKFNFSDRNKSEENVFSKTILDYINENYLKYKNVSTASTPIDLSTNIFANWIISHYQKRNVKYIITATNNNNPVIFPVTKYGSYFNISATFRIKRSGSRDLSRNYIDEIQSLISTSFGNCNIHYEGKKAIATINSYVPDKTKLYGSTYTYQLNFVSNGVYLIRMLSNTNNPNVIFSVSLRQAQNPEDLYLFKRELE